MQPSAPKQISVALLDDHPIVRSGLTHQLQQHADICVIASYGSSRNLMHFLQTTPVDVIVTDFALGNAEIDGLNLIRALHVRHPASRIIVVSSHYNQATVGLAMKAGAKGFIGKIHEPRELITAVLTVMRGNVYLHPDMKGMIDPDGEASASNQTDSLSLTPLSAREAEVIRCVLEGMSTTEISTKFSRQPNTVSTQKRAAYRKLGITNDGELHRIRHLLNL